MAFFTTFYSFKGGVGRTLALANVATLLARDPDEPCKVLVWDFDLAAPGLQNVFKCGWGKARAGFIDYVYHYLTTGEIENISSYIYKTDIEGVDILPAGARQDYPQKLEDIKWRNIYREARGFHFIEAVKKQLEALETRYDYILVDSLTGYSDAGGICVRQIPDAVVFLFRLNQQNLSGIGNVYRALRQSDDGRQASVPVIPVVSPAWPFASLEANDWIPRAAKVFPESKILEISFEGALTLGEQVISKDKHKFAIAPKIIEDYDSLTRAIRDKNPQDIKTMFKDVSGLRYAGQLKEAAERVLELLERRPNKSSYWNELVSLYNFATDSESPGVFEEKVASLIAAQMILKNPHAFVAQSALPKKESVWQERVQWLTQAIEIDPGIAEAYSRRASIFASRNLASRAIEDYTRLLDLPWPNRTEILVQRGKCYLDVLLLDKALADFNAVLRVKPRDETALLLRSRALLGLEQYDAALESAEKFLTLSKNEELGLLTKAYAFAGLGETAKAIQELEKISQLKRFSRENIAEAYLFIDPHKSISILTTSKVKEDKTPHSFLLAFAKELIGEHKEASELFEVIEQQKQHVIWSFFEARIVIRILAKKALLSKESAGRLERAIELLESRSEVEDVYPPTDWATMEAHLRSLFRN